MAVASGPTPSRAAMLALVRSFLLAILPQGVEVVIGQANRVPEVTSADFVVVTPMELAPIETTTSTWAGAGKPPPTTILHTVGHRAKLQLDVHGEASTDNANVISTLWRTIYSADFFNQPRTGVAPLYAQAPRQVPFQSGEDQWEDRWVIEAFVQMNVAVATNQQFAATLTPTVVPADALLEEG